jgi:hypothetical protein
MTEEIRCEILAVVPGEKAAEGKAVLVAADEKAALDEILDHVKCIKQLVLNVRKNARCHSNLQKASQFTAKIAIRRKKDINYSKIYQFIYYFVFGFCLSEMSFRKHF